MNELFIHIKSGNANRIYNKISNSEGISIYPDIWYNHPYEEVEIRDDELYETALIASKKYGSSQIIFAEFADKQSEISFREMLTSFSMTEQAISDPALITRFCEDLMFSEAMKINFNKLIQYYVLTGGTPGDIIEPFYSEYALPVASKKEGKMLYDIIRNQILG